MKKKVLYISYDGMTDPLGQSQVLPYLEGLSKLGYQFTILSFEKKDRYEKNKEAIQRIVDKAGISWEPLSFTSHPPIFSKFYDAVRMRKKAIRLCRKERFDMVHCRSYIAADVGLLLKRKFGTKFFFDMRGFWADEKRDGGAWKDNHPVFKRVYKYYKKKEASYLREAEIIVSLTVAGKKELQTWPVYNPAVPVEVIPCCADLQHFSLTSDTQKKHGRDILGISHDRLVVSYLGSIGTWYMLDEMLALFLQIKKTYPTALFLFVSHSDPKFIRDAAKRYKIDPQDIFIIEATRQQVPVFIKSSDINLSFIRPVYSKISSSPTKLGEVLSMGIPVICNAGVGDVEEIVHTANAGFVIKDFNEMTYENAVSAIPDLIEKEYSSIRNAVKDIFSLESGIKRYAKCYQTVFTGGKRV